MALTNQELLERIAPYLPYGVKCIKMGEVNEDNNPIISTVNSITNNITSTGTVWVDSESEDGKSFCNIIEDVFLILRPLSDLTKPCLKGGIIPLEDLKEELGFGWCDAYSDALEVLEDNAHYTRLSELMIRMPYEFINYFISHHFDVFNLIEQGYAIDVNTINTK